MDSKSRCASGCTLAVARAVELLDRESVLQHSSDDVRRTYITHACAPAKADSTLPETFAVTLTREARVGR